MNIENNHINYSFADIEKYWKGELSKAEMHRMEQTAMDDPFLADAMDGFRSAGDRVPADVDALQQRLSKRLNEEEEKVVGLPARNWWRIAAVFILLAGIGASVYFFTGNTNISESRTLAKNKSPLPPASEETVSAATPALADSAPAKSFGHENAYSDTTFVSSDHRQLSSANEAPQLKPVMPAQLRSREANPVFQKDSVVSQKDIAFVANDAMAKSAAAPDLKKEAKEGESFQKTVAGNFFAGRVVDSSNRPISNATIVFRSEKRALSTDANGYFNFIAPDSIADVTINSVGYEAKEVTLLNNNLAANNIRMKQSNAALNEVVVVGYGAQRKKDLSASKALSGNVQQVTPVVSFVDYDSYLLKNKRVPETEKDVHGDVVVSFMVSKEGELSKFKIEKSLSTLLDKEAIRLVKEGPQWKALTDKKARATVIVKF